MIHMTPRVDQVKHEGFHEAAAELKAEGRVRFLGLSNHGPEHSVYGRVESPMEEPSSGRLPRTAGSTWPSSSTTSFRRDQGERIIEACRARDMGVTLMKTNPVGVVARASGIAAAARASGRISEARERTLQEYEAWAKAAEDFKEQHGVRSATEVRDAAIKFCLDHSGVHTVCPIHEHLRRPGRLRRPLRTDG